MRKRRTAVVAMSGGVDSAVAAALMLRDGWDVVGITLQIWQEHADADRHGGCCSLGAVEDARRAASRLGIAHYVLDMREAFAADVVDRFVADYARGRTPNPCVECNRTVKFDALMRHAVDLGADVLVTGHYARVDGPGDEGAYRLLRARDLDKDQSYALYALTQEQLARTRLPLGNMTSKSDTRALAQELGLSVAGKPDSQEICFVPREGYTRFLRERRPEVLEPGPIVDQRGRVIGRHEGIAFYTIGQRRRLPASPDGPLFVTAINAPARTVVTGPHSALFGSALRADGVNWIAGAPPPLPLAVQARIRYNGCASAACITQAPRPGEVVCRFNEPQRAITPGQAAVFYDGDRVYGGGTIVERLET